MWIPKKKEAQIKMECKGLFPEEEKQLKEMVAKMSRNRRYKGKARLEFELDFGNKKYVSHTNRTHTRTIIVL